MSTWADRRRDARGFWEVAQAAHDPAHAPQAAANAILAVIAANDAICLYLAGRQPHGRSHTEAAQVLREVCRGTPWEQAAGQRAQQLLEVLRQKNAAQYQGRDLSPAQAAKIMRQAERFLTWAQEVLPARGGEEASGSSEDQA